MGRALRPVGTEPSVFLDPLFGAGPKVTSGKDVIAGESHEVGEPVDVAVE